MGYMDEEKFTLENVKKDPVAAMDEFCQWFDKGGNYTESRMAVRAAVEVVRQFMAKQGVKSKKKAKKAPAKKAKKAKKK